jgi:hypothetical protein
MTTPADIKIRQQAQQQSRITRLISAFEAAKNTVLAPITYADDTATNKVHTQRANEVYGNLIGLALSDLQGLGFITDHVLAHLESALKEFPAQAISEIMEQSDQPFDVHRKCLQISFNSFTNTVKPLMDEIKALSPSSTPNHHQQDMACKL